MKTQPTPGPWIAHIEPDGRHRCHVIMANWECDGNEPYHPLLATIRFGGGKNDVPRDVAAANAEHIVRCVNAAPKAIAALEGLLGRMQSEMTGFSKKEQEKRQFHIKEARSALADLKGE